MLGPSSKSSGRLPSTLEICSFKQAACECQHRPFPQQMRFATGMIGLFVQKKNFA